MKTFSEFIIESEQQSGALAAHLARTAADRASQSGTVGGTEKDFKKRPSLGLKRPTLPSFKRKERIKDKGSRKPAPYGSGAKPQKALPGSRDDVQKVDVKVEKPAEKKPALKPAADRPALKPAASSTSIAKRSSQSIRNAGKNTAGSVQKARVRVEPTQRPALQPAAKRPALRPAAERGNIKPAVSRPALPAGSGRPIAPAIKAAAKQAALKAAQQRKALPPARS